MHIGLPEQFKIVDASAGPVTTNGGVTCDYVSLKGVKRAWIVASFTQAVAHATTVQPQKATAVAPTGATSITVAQRIWANEDTATSDTLVAQTAATSYAVTADVKKKQVIFEIDPASFGTTYDVLGCTISNSAQATDFVSVIYILEEGYAQATPPSRIVD
jgi:hypothetical protein